MNTDQRIRSFTASLSQAATADACYRAVETFCSDVCAATPALEFSPHSLASDLLSVCAAGAVQVYQAQAALPARSGRAVFALLLARVFGWSQLDAWVRAEALWAEAPAPGSDLARLMNSSRAVFHFWQESSDTPRAARLGVLLQLTVENVENDLPHQSGAPASSAILAWAQPAQGW